MGSLSTFLPFALCALCCASFAYSVIGVFRRPEKIDSFKFNFLKGLSIAAYLLSCRAVWLGTMTTSPLMSGNLLWVLTAVFTFALLIFWWTAFTIRANRFDYVFSQEQPNRVVMCGPYRYFRHPFYAVYMITYVAAWLSHPEVWTLVPLIALGFLYVIAAFSEEKRFLDSPFKEAYLQYRSGRKKLSN